MKKIQKGVASLFGLGPAAALDLAALGCGTPLGLASGIACGQGGPMPGNGYFPSGYGGQPGYGGGYDQGCGGQLQVIARPILPYFRANRRGFPMW